ncbi:papain-like cysteine protease family protein [Hamadaea tsunoensis]|uniref:papain-like cysteine protease family protein n=1 Tax=Hamadaea tsunoensis TaxID=53368 RepID=UPI0004160BEA|nr:papain-like cysteine protease family protein [Hamadaea tsunoensis]
MRNPATRRSRAVTLAAVLAAAVALPAQPAASAPVTAAAQPAAHVAAAQEKTPAQEKSAAQEKATGRQATTSYTWHKLGITMQSQVNSNWCWAASGNTVAAYLGFPSYSQNQFCNLAFDRSINSTCPNSQANLGNDQEAFRQIGISPGYYYNGYLSYNTVINEIDALRPVMTRIQWQSGGGHMMVLYGYDKSQNWVYWGDPWPSDTRYNWATWSYYVSNSSFFWTHSLYQIGM